MANIKPQKKNQDKMLEYIKANKISIYCENDKLNDGDFYTSQKTKQNNITNDVKP